MFKIFVIFIIVVFFGTIFVMAIAASSAGKKMKRKASDAGAEDMLTASHVEGLGLALKEKCDIYRYSDKLLIDSYGRKFEVKLNQVRAAVTKNEKEIIEKGKSVVGRAAIGTLLLPGLGTIIGGMSGVGKKQVNGQTNFYLIINYVDGKGDLQGITFLNNLNMLKLSQFCIGINSALSAMDHEIVNL